MLSLHEKLIEEFNLTISLGFVVNSAAIEGAGMSISTGINSEGETLP